VFAILVTIIATASLVAFASTQGLFNELISTHEEPVDAEVPNELSGTYGDIAAAEVQEESEVISQVAGNWRSQWFESYTANDTIISLFADGRWEWSGPLSTDHVDGGRFFIAREEDGIYHLSLIVEHSTSPYAEVGFEREEFFQYDLQNDRLSHQGIGEFAEKITIWYKRVPYAARDAAPTWNEDALTHFATSTPEGIEYHFDVLGFAFTLPNSWDGYYEIRGGDEGYLTVYFHAMGVMAELFSICANESYWELDEFIVTLTFHVGNTRYAMYYRDLRHLLLATEDFSSPGWEFSNEMNQGIRDTLERMFHEADTIVADSILRSLSDAT